MVKKLWQLFWQSFCQLFGQSWVVVLSGLLWLAMIVAIPTAVAASATFSSSDSSSSVTVSTTSKDVSQATITVKNTELILGEAVILTVRGEKAVKQFERRSLLPLQQDFVVEVVDSQTERLRLKLFPVSTGQFVLPKIELRTARLAAQPVTVSKNPEITLNWPELPQKIYPQQLVVESLQFELPSEAWRFTFEAPVMDSQQRQQWQANALKIRRDQTNLNRYQLTNLYEFNAFVEPLTTVAARVPKMHLKVRRPNGRYWHFYSPNHRLEISALPSFVPTTSSVGRLQWQSQQATWSHLGEISYWNWSLSAKNVSPIYLQHLGEQLLQSLQQIESVEWLSAQFQAQQTLEKGELIQSLQIQVPYRPNHLWWSTPELRLGYFDPQTGKWQQESLPAGWHISLPSWVYSLGKVLAVLLLGWIIWQLVGVFWAIKHWRRLTARARSAQSVSQVTQVMFEWQSQRLSGSWRFEKGRSATAQTYGDWLAAYQPIASSRQAWASAQYLVNLLQKNCYARPQSLQPPEQAMAELQNALNDWLASESLWRQLRRK